MIQKDALYRATNDLASDIAKYNIKVDLAARTIAWNASSRRIPPYTTYKDCYAIIRRLIRKAQSQPDPNQITLL